METLKHLTIAWILPAGAGLATAYLLLVPIPLDILEIPLGDILAIPMLVIFLALKYGRKIALGTGAFIARFVVAHVIASFCLLAFSFVQLAFSGVLIGDMYLEGKFLHEQKGDVPPETGKAPLKIPSVKVPKGTNTPHSPRQELLLSEIKELNEYIEVLLAQEKQEGGKDAPKHPNANGP